MIDKETLEDVSDNFIIQEVSILDDFILEAKD